LFFNNLEISDVLSGSTNMLIQSSVAFAMLHDIYSICTIELIPYEKFVYTKGDISDIKYA